MQIHKLNSVKTWFCTTLNMKKIFNLIVTAASILMLALTVGSALEVNPIYPAAVLSVFAIVTLFVAEPKGILRIRGIFNKPDSNVAVDYQFYEWVAGAVPYAATINLPVFKAVNEQHIYLDTLTGAATINIPSGSKVNLVKGDVIVMVIPSDATGRTITWGTFIKSSAATLAIVASGKTLIYGVFDGTDVVIR
jgi:hypothetical protein